MKPVIGTTIAMLLLALAGSARAHPPKSDTFTSVVRLSSFPSTPPYSETYAGTFTTPTGDSGSESVQARFAAVHSPTVGDLHTLVTLASHDGHSTLELRCEQLATAQDFSTYPDVPSSGTCAVLNATGSYAELTGSGPLNGTVAFDPSGTSATLTDTVTLSR
jgi:hypothetical protein